MVVGYSLHQDKSPSRLTNGSNSPKMLAKSPYGLSRVGAPRTAKGSPASSNEDTTASLKVQRKTQLASHSDGEGSEGSLKVKWDPSKAAANESGEEKDLDASNQHSRVGGMPRQIGRPATIVRRSTYNVADVPTSNWRSPQQCAPAGENPLKVEWNPSMAAASPTSSEEDISISQSKQLSASPANLKVNWKASMASASPNSSEEDTTIPKVSWKKAAQPVTTGNDNIPKVKWRASQPPSTKENSLKVKWNPSMASTSSPSSEEELSSQQVQQQQQQPVSHNPLKVKWNAAMATTSPTSSEEDVRIPKVNWRAKGKRQQPPPSTTGNHDNPLKVKWTPNMATSSPASSEEDLSVHPGHSAMGHGSSPRSSPAEDQGGQLSVHQSRYSAYVTTSAGQGGTGPRSGLPQAAQRNPSPGRYLAMPSASGAGLVHRTPPQTRLASPGRPAIAASQGIPLASSPQAARRLPSPARGGAVQPRRSPANNNISRSPSPGRAKAQVTPVGSKFQGPSPRRSSIEGGAIASLQSSQLQQAATPLSVSPGQRLAAATGRISQSLKGPGKAIGGPNSGIQQTSPSSVPVVMKPRKSGLRPPSPNRWWARFPMRACLYLTVSSRWLLCTCS